MVAMRNSHAAALTILSVVMFSSALAAQPASASLGVSVVVAPSCRVNVGTSNALQNGRGNKTGVELQCAGRAEKSVRAANGVPQAAAANARAFDVVTTSGATIDINF